MSGVILYILCDKIFKIEGITTSPTPTSQKTIVHGKFTASSF